MKKEGFDFLQDLSGCGQIHGQYNGMVKNK